MAGYKKALGMETENAAGSGSVTDETNESCEGREKWVEGLGFDSSGREGRKLLDMRRQERKKRRKEKLQKRRERSDGIDIAARTKVVVFLALKHPTAPEGRLFVPLSCLPQHDSQDRQYTLPEVSTRGKKEEKLKSLERHPSEVKPTKRKEKREREQGVIVYSVNTEKAGGVPLSQVYSSYYTLMRGHRKKTEETTLEVHCSEFSITCISS